MSEEKSNSTEAIKDEVAPWSFSLSSVVPLIIIIPISFYLVGKVFDWPEAAEIGGYLAAGVLGIFLIAFVLNLIWWRKFIGSTEAKARRAEAVMQQIIADESLLLEIGVKNRTLLKVKSKNNYFVNSETGSRIEESELKSALITARGFPRISKTS